MSRVCEKQVLEESKVEIRRKQVLLKLGIMVGHGQINYVSFLGNLIFLLFSPLLKSRFGSPIFCFLSLSQEFHFSDSSLARPRQFDVPIRRIACFGPT